VWLAQIEVSTLQKVVPERAAKIEVGVLAKKGPNPER
jgi:hypothetical protein